MFGIYQPKGKIVKRICILQVTPEEPNEDHVRFFENKEQCDFYFVTHDAPNEKALKYCPNTTWVDTRNILADLVPKEYEYYAFVDYDFIFEPKGNLEVLDQILFDLNKWNPAVLTYYPGKGFISPFVDDAEYFNKYEYSIIPFTHCGMKVIHHTLLDWFFPMVTKFGGGVDACHLFNILELPFLKNVVCSHQMVYRNDVNDPKTPHNKSGAISKMNMDKMWHWITPSFKKYKLLQLQYGQRATDSLVVKAFFVDLFKKQQIDLNQEQKGIDYFSIERMEKFFDLNHERFSSIR
tara:strand:- start:14983 stop:15861 length:879 start_codon:yes stop_codon:yes gene_type:complete